MSSALLLLLLALAAPLAAQAPLPVHVGGRAVHEADGSWRFGWPGVYFESRFRGTGITIAVETPTEFLRVSVDGADRGTLIRPGTARLTLSGLTPGEHVVRLDKMTESQEGGGRFLGFLSVAGDVALPPPTRARRIEFIGDSFTVGYGDAVAGADLHPPRGPRLYRHQPRLERTGRRAARRGLPDHRLFGHRRDPQL